MLLVEIFVCDEVAECWSRIFPPNFQYDLALE